MTLLIIQLIVSVVLLWAGVLAQGVRVRLNQDTVHLGLIGILNPGLAYLFSLLGLSRTTASMSAVLWAAEPILIIGFAWLVLGERLTASLLACAALAILAWSWPQALTWLGELLGRCSARCLSLPVCVALYTVLTRRNVATLAPLGIVALQQTVALLVALVIWPLEWLDGTGVQLRAVPISMWVWGVAAGFVYYTLAFYLYITGLTRASASLAGLFLNLIPLFGLAGAYLFLGERLTQTQWGGAIIILVAVTLIVRLQRPAPVPIPETLPAQ